MKKLMFALLVVIMTGCSSTSYEKVALQGYGRSVADGRFMSKEGSEKSYYKYNNEDAKVYLILEKDEVSQKVVPLLSLEYRGETWLYIENVAFRGSEKKAEIDFVRERFSGAPVQEIPRASGSVVERILIPVTDEKLQEIEEVLLSESNIEIVYSSRYRNGTSSTKLSPRDKEGLITMIKLYNKTKGENVNGN